VKDFIAKSHVLVVLANNCVFIGHHPIRYSGKHHLYGIQHILWDKSVEELKKIKHRTLMKSAPKNRNVLISLWMPFLMSSL